VPTRLRPAKRGATVLPAATGKQDFPSPDRTFLSHNGASDLLEAFDVTAPSVSYHLKILREAGLISSERRGTWIYYRVNPDVMARMSAVLAPPAAGPAA
jgi:DNA-binding transcriptional ArsR family regulator